MLAPSLWHFRVERRLARARHERMEAENRRSYRSPHAYSVRVDIKNARGLALHGTTFARAGVLWT